MIIDETKRDCINMIAQGIGVTEIAKAIGYSRQAVYDWLKDEEFKAELDKVLQRIKTEGEQKILVSLDKYINNIAYLANHANSEKIKLEANTYLTDRVLGRPTSKHEVEATAKQDNNKVSLEDFEAELEEIEVLEE